MVVSGDVYAAVCARRQKRAPEMIRMPRHMDLRFVVIAAVRLQRVNAAILDFILLTLCLRFALTAFRIA